MDHHETKLADFKTDDKQSASQQAAAAPPLALSATAVAALTQLLTACLAQQSMPTLQDVMKDRQEKLESSGISHYSQPTFCLTRTLCGSRV